MRFEDEPTEGSADDPIQKLIDLRDQMPQRTRTFIQGLIDNSGIEFPPRVNPRVAVDLLTSFVNDASEQGVFKGAYFAFTPKFGEKSVFQLLTVTNHEPDDFTEWVVANNRIGHDEALVRDIPALQSRSLMEMGLALWHADERAFFFTSPIRASQVRGLENEEVVRLILPESQYIGFIPPASEI